MNQHNLEVLAKIIICVETGGQVYGRGRYNDYTPPYKNTPNEHTCTLGCYQAYGHEARELIQRIHDADPAAFKRLDTCSPSIESMLKKDWVGIRWNPSSSQKNVLVKLIDSPLGHKMQDTIVAEKCKAMVEQCVKLYPATEKNIKAQMMWAEIKHLGGLKPAQRIFNRCNGKFDLDTIMAALVRDQKDTSSSNQVGDKIFWSRHVKCRQYIDQYAVDEGSAPAAPVSNTVKPAPQKEAEKGKTMAITEKDITICGHGSGNPRTTRMDTYGTQRYAGTATGIVNGKRQTWHKGLVAVVRRKGMTDALRAKYVATYKTILGRNVYSNDLRDYVFTPYRNGKYYSDCSSSQNATLTRIGLKTPAFTTVEMYKASGYFDILPAKIEKGHLLNPEILKIGDMLLYAGSSATRKLHIGHVEGVYAIKGSTINTDTSPSTPASTIAGSQTVADFQKFMLSNYRSLVGADLVIDGEYGAKTRAAAVAVWKYMANKYYGAHLTVGNSNFFESCKKVSEQMNDAEINEHPTLAYILQGVLAGKGWYNGDFDAEIGPKTKEAIKKLQKAKGLTADGKMNANTWYVLFN